MANWRYKRYVSPPAQALAEQGMYYASVFVEGAEAPPYYPDEALEALHEIERQLAEVPDENESAATSH